MGCLYNFFAPAAMYRSHFRQELSVDDASRDLFVSVQNQGIVSKGNHKQ